MRSMLVKPSVVMKEVRTSLPKGHHRCGRCNICAVMTETKKISIPDLRFEMELRTFTTCNSSFMVYSLECACQLRYIGSTQRQLRVRIQEHIIRIKNEVLEAPLTPHYLEKGHQYNDMKVVVLECVEAQPYKDQCKLLLQREMY